MTNEKLTQEFIKKVSMAKSPEEIVALAKENGMEIPQDEAEMLYTQLQSQSGELSDEELDNVAGGYSPMQELYMKLWQEECKKRMQEIEEQEKCM
ncbi:MAG: Nif11-like leader peptide family RiPP precursor [Clostridia bacterium]|nr:Nif11-like leader peptide family RiPP precursor [Clostridia bacterium]